MNGAMKRILAIFAKDFKDASRNSQVWFPAIMPIGFAFLYSSLESGSTSMLPFVLMLTLGMAGATSQALMIAEEKEKQTLRMLMLSPAKMYEVLIGKAVLLFLLVIVINFIVMAIYGTELNDFGLFTLLSVPLVITFLLLGTFIGLLARTVAETSVWAVLIILAICMLPLMVPAFDNALLMSVSDLLMTSRFIDIINGIQSGEGSSALGMDWLIIGIWMVVSVIAVYIAYKRNAMDK